MALVDVDDARLDYAELREDPAQGIFSAAGEEISEFSSNHSSIAVQDDLRDTTHEESSTEYYIKFSPILRYTIMWGANGEPLMWPG